MKHGMYLFRSIDINTYGAARVDPAQRDET
jgi:hypothetical protein